MKIEFNRLLSDNLDFLPLSDESKELARFNNMQLARGEIFKLIAEEVIKQIDKKIDWRMEDTPEGFQKIIGVLNIQFTSKNDTTL